MMIDTQEQAAELLALRAQREQLHRELVRKSYRIAELEEQLFESTRTYEESLSWRLTRPLREARGILRRRS